MLRLRTPLFDTATDAGDAGGGTPAAAATPPPAAAPAAETPPGAPAPVAAKPGVIDSAISMFRDKGVMQNEITSLKKTNGDLTAENTRLKEQLKTVTGERDNLQAGFNRLEAALQTAQTEKTTVQTEVTHQLAAAGVPESGLPKGTPTPKAEVTGDDKIADLNKQIEASSDPKEKGRLANEVWDLMKKSSSRINVAAN
jgi:regulator of replication initiation timing